MCVRLRVCVPTTPHKKDVRAENIFRRKKSHQNVCEKVRTPAMQSGTENSVRKLINSVIPTGNYLLGRRRALQNAAPAGSSTLSGVANKCTLLLVLRRGALSIISPRVGSDRTQCAINS